MKLRYKVLSGLLLALLLFLYGCGGGGRNSVPKSIAPSVSVDWAARTRGVAGPSSALSVSFTLHDPNGKRSDVTILGNRSGSLAAHTDTFTANSKILPGTYTLSGSFYAASNQGGMVVGTFGLTVAVQTNGTVTNSDGSPLGNVEVAGVVKSVVVAANQTVVLQQTLQLSAAAHDATGNVIVLSPGSFTFSVASGATSLSVTPDGVATGNGDGPATVTASVDGVTSIATPVLVVGPTTLTLSVEWPTRTRGLTGPSSALSVSFTVTDPSGKQNPALFAGERTSSLAAYTGTYYSDFDVFPGAFTLTGTFYSASNSGGIAVATFGLNVAVQQDGTITNPDGSALGPVQLVGAVKSVVVAANQTVLVNSPSQLMVSALDANGEPLAISAGSFSFNVVSGTSNLSVTPDGIATGKVDGIASVAATADGISSAPTTVSIVEPASALLTVGK